MCEYEVIGLEFEGCWIVIDNFVLFGNLMWIDVEISKDVNNFVFEGNILCC